MTERDNIFRKQRIWMGSMTALSNRPFRRLIYELGAEASLGEMTIAHYAAKGGKQDLALLKREPCERCFGAQIVGSRIKELIKTAKMAEDLGADFIDFNCACPHESVIRHCAGAYLLKQPQRIAELIKALRDAISLPLSLKIRKGYDAEDDVVPELVELAKALGLSAVFIHGRSKVAQYRGPNDWDCIERAAKNSDLPIIGCGDLAHASDVRRRLDGSACAGVALARGALIKPWIFRELQNGETLDPSAEERLELFKRLIQHSLDCFGHDARGLDKSKVFLKKQWAFLSRYVPAPALGRELGLQERAEAWQARSDLEELWARNDGAAFEELLQRADWPISAG